MKVLWQLLDSKEVILQVYGTLDQIGTPGMAPHNPEHLKEKNNHSNNNNGSAITYSFVNKDESFLLQATGKYTNPFIDGLLKRCIC